MKSDNTFASRMFKGFINVSGRTVFAENDCKLYVITPTDVMQRISDKKIQSLDLHNRAGT